MSRTNEIANEIATALDRLIEDALENFVLQADQIEGLEDELEKTVENAIDNYDFSDVVGDIVKEAINDHREVDAGDVDGLDVAIRKELENWDLTELNEEIAKQVNETFPFADTLIQHLDSDYVRPTLVPAVCETFKTSQVQDALDKAVAASLQRVLGRLLTGIVPIASPVSQGIKEGHIVTPPLGVPTPNQPLNNKEDEQHVRDVLSDTPTNQPKESSTEQLNKLINTIRT